MASTKRQISEQILRRLSAGNPSVASKVHPLEIDKAVEQVLNGLLRIQHLEQLQLDETIPAGGMLAFYENIPVVPYRGVSKCTLPVIPITLTKGMGVFSIRPHADADDSSTGGSTGGLIPNFDSFTYNQLTGEFVFDGSNVPGTYTRVTLRNSPGSGSYINAEGMAYSVGPFEGNSITIEYLTPPQVYIFYDRISASTLEVLATEKVELLTITRLARRWLYLQDGQSKIGYFQSLKVYNIEGGLIGTATTIEQVVTLWNSDPINQAFGTAIGSRIAPNGSQFYQLHIEPVASANVYPVYYIRVSNN
jgi:hypothetical protein